MLLSTGPVTIHGIVRLTLFDWDQIEQHTRQVNFVEPHQSKSAVKVAAHRLRKRFRGTLKEEIALTLDEDGEEAIAAELRQIYTATSVESAKAALTSFRATHDAEHPAIGKSWAANWRELTPFFDYPPEIRKVIYTTNAIESLNSSFRRISRHRNLFPTVEPLYKLFYLSLKNISAKWTRSVNNWSGALNHYAIEFEDRVPTNR